MSDSACYMYRGWCVYSAWGIWRACIGSRVLQATTEALLRQRIDVHAGQTMP